MKKRLLSILCILALCAALLPSAALAADPVYLALGDSITTGYAPGNTKVTRPFADQVAAAQGYALTNLAADGETSATLKAKLEDGTIDVSKADLITITIGGNDLVNALYDYLAEACQSDGSAVTAGSIEAMLAGGNVDAATLAALVQALPGFTTSTQAKAALDAFSENLSAIVGAIDVANPDAALVVTTQYNPYRALAKAYGGIVPQAQTVSDAFDAGVAALNRLIQAGTASGAYAVADVSAAFNAAIDGTPSVNPCNATAVPLNLDFHPNQDGHDLIAKTILGVLRQAGETGSEPLPFTDVSEANWFYEAVSYVYENGLMNGTADTAFSPAGATSRAMLATILWRQAGSPVVNYLLPFDDVPGGTWYTEAVRWAASEKIVGGYDDGTFRPDAPITREQLAAMLYRWAQHQGMDVSIGEDTNILSYLDAFSVSEYAMPAMQWACGAGIIQGDGALLNPQGNATRSQTAAMLMRFFDTGPAA